MTIGLKDSKEAAEKTMGEWSRPAEPGIGPAAHSLCCGESRKVPLEDPKKEKKMPIAVAGDQRPPVLVVAAISGY